MQTPEINDIRESKTTVKWTVLILIHKLLYNCQLTLPAVLVAYTIESLQLAQFSLSRNTPLFSEPTASDFLSSIVRCTTLNFIFESHISATIIFSFCSKNSRNIDLFVLLGVIPLLARLIFVLRKKQPMSQFDNLLVTIVNFAFFIFRTVYLLPLMELLFMCLSPSRQKLYGLTFSQETKLLLVIVAGISSFLFLAYLAISLCMLRDPDPFSKSSFQGPLRCNQVVLTLLKIAASIYKFLDPLDKGIRIFQILAILVYLTWVVYRSQQTNHYTTTTQKLSQMLPSFVFWFTLSKTLTYELPPSTDPFVSFLVVYFVLLVTIQFAHHISQSRLLSKALITMKSDQEIESHFLYLISAIEMIELPNNRIILQGYLGNHIQSCKLNTCSCSKLTSVKKRGILVDQQKLWYHFLVGLLKQTLQKFQRSQRLFLLIATILKKRLNNKFAALYNLAKCEQIQESFIYNIAIFHNRQSIQYDMIKDDDISNEKKTVNINKFFEFNNLVVKFQRILEICVNEYIEFWKELMEASIDIKKLEDFGTMIISQKENVCKIFDQLNTLNPNNIHILIIYGSFLQNVSNQESKHQKLFQRADSIKRNLKVSQLITDQAKMKYGQNSQTAIFVISGNQHELGSIQNINNQVKNLLGWTRQDLLGHNLSMIMPKVYGQSHDMVLNRYLSTSQDKFNCKQRSAPALTKDGFMVPCTAMTKSLPNLEKGIQMVGFLSKMRQSSTDNEYSVVNDKLYSYLLYRTDTQVVQGVSKSCSQFYGIPPSLVYGHPQNTIYELKLNHIFVDSPEIQEYKQILRSSPYLLKIDTSKIHSQFPVNFEFPNRSLKDQEEEYGVPQNKGISITVSVQIKLQQTYAGVPLVLLCLWLDKSKDWRADEEFGDVYQKRKKSVVNSTLNSYVTMDEELKQIKEFKGFISEKRQPLSIKIVFNSALWLIIFLFILTYLSFKFLQQRNSLFFDAVNTVNLCQYNSMTLSQQAYNLRKLHIYNTWLSQTTNSQSMINSTFKNILELNTYLQSNQFSLQPIKYQIEYRGTNPWQQIYGMRFNPLSHQIQLQPSNLELQIHTFISNTNTVLSTDLQQLNFSPYRPDYQPQLIFQAFISSIESVLFQLVSEQAESTTKIVKFYNCLLNQCSYEFAILLGMSLGLITIAMSIIIPYVISVNNINNRVLSLFGMIPLVEIQSFLSKCGQYLTDNLVEAVPAELNLQYLNNPVEYSVVNPLSPSGLVSPAEPKSPLPLLRRGTSKDLRNPIRSFTATSKQGFDRQRKNVERSEQFLSYSDNSIPKTIIQYGLISLIFAAYFISDYFITKSLFGTMQLGLKNIYNYNLRLQQLRHLKTCSVQSIIDPSLNPNANPPIKNLTASLIDSLYDTQRAVSDIDTSQFSSQYSQLIRKINQDNVCSGVQLYDVDFDLPLQYEGLSQQECHSIQNGLFEKGLHTVVISTLQRIRADLSANTSSIQAKKQYLLDNYPKMELIQKYTQYPILYTLKELRTLLENKLGSFRLMELGKMVGFMVVVSVLYRVLWLPYLKELNVKIWRTKGMLNMIPMSIIIKNEKLKNEFTSGMLEKAVR